MGTRSDCAPSPRRSPAFSGGSGARRMFSQVSIANLPYSTQNPCLARISGAHSNPSVPRPSLVAAWLEKGRSLTPRLKTNFQFPPTVHQSGQSRWTVLHGTPASFSSRQRSTSINNVRFAALNELKCRLFAGAAAHCRALTLSELPRPAVRRKSTVFEVSPPSVGNVRHYAFPQDTHQSTKHFKWERGP